MNLSKIQRLNDPLFVTKKIQVEVLREDLNHPFIQGNKLRKLHYNLSNAKKKGNTTLLTFGGAYSNHILALAQAGFEFDFKTIGIIRGEETLPLNYTLRTCKELGMEIHYIDRTTYKLKNTPDFKDYLRNTYGAFYLIPEGGSNYYAVNGCMEILPPKHDYDYICCPMGTGGTIAGITISNQNKAKVLGFSALKGGDFLKDEVLNFMNMVINDSETAEELMQCFSVISDYHCGGYAKVSEDLINFVQDFYRTHDFKWDLIYNGKMALGVYDKINTDFFPPGSKILMIHTGGLQGINGFEERNNRKIYD
ncbi:MAG: pyridoxal-phosphate dependent enzyme [Flavobacteriales bacterium]